MKIGIQIAESIWNFFFNTGTSPSSPNKIKIIKFEVTREEFKQRTFEWLIQNPVVPEDMGTAIDTFRFFGAFIPFYIFRGEYSANVTTYDKDTKNNQPQTPIKGCFTELAIATSLSKRDWRYWLCRIFFYLHIQHLPKFLRDFRSSSSFLDPDLKISGIVSFCEKSDEWVYIKDKIIDFNESYIMYFSKLSFTIDKNKAKSKIERRIRHKVNARKFGLREDLGLVDKPQVDIKVSKPSINPTEYIKIYLPFWFATFLYGNNKYYYMVDGQDKSRKGKGSAPKDIKNVITIFLYIILLLLFIFLFLVTYIIVDSMCWKVPLMFFSAIIEIVIAIFFYKFLKKSEKIREECLLLSD